MPGPVSIYRTKLNNNKRVNFKLIQEHFLNIEEEEEGNEGDNQRSSRRDSFSSTASSASINSVSCSSPSSAPSAASSDDECDKQTTSRQVPSSSAVSAPSTASASKIRGPSRGSSAAIGTKSILKRQSSSDLDTAATLANSNNNRRTRRSSVSSISSCEGTGHRSASGPLTRTSINKSASQYGSKVSLVSNATSFATASTCAAWRLKKHDKQSKRCKLCHEDVTYFEQVLKCGHTFHGDCIWRWLKSHTNRPDERNLCPQCGFLDKPSSWTRTSRSRSSSVCSVDGDYVVVDTVPRTSTRTATKTVGGSKALVQRSTSVSSTESSASSSSAPSSGSSSASSTSTSSDSESEDGKVNENRTQKRIKKRFSLLSLLV